MNRRDEREQAFLLIFEYTINQESVAQIIENAGQARDLTPSAFASSVATGAQEQQERIDQTIAQYSRGWQLRRLPRVSLALLRLAVYEMCFLPEIPLSVSINEVVDLAKKYGGKEDAPFINGVLGSVAKELEKADV